MLLLPLSRSGDIDLIEGAGPDAVALKVPRYSTWSSAWVAFSGFDSAKTWHAQFFKLVGSTADISPQSMPSQLQVQVLAAKCLVWEPERRRQRRVPGDRLEAEDGAAGAVNAFDDEDPDPDPEFDVRRAFELGLDEDDAEVMPELGDALDVAEEAHAEQQDEPPPPPAAQPAPAPAAAGVPAPLVPGPGAALVAAAAAVPDEPEPGWRGAHSHTCVLSRGCVLLVVVAARATGLLFGRILGF